SVPNPAAMDLPWTRIALSRTAPSMDLADPEFNETPSLHFAATFNPAHAEELFAGSGHTFAEIATLAKDRKPMPHFPLAVAVQAKAHVDNMELESDNLVAEYPGDDPRLRHQYVVLSAHVDHVG